MIKDYIPEVGSSCEYLMDLNEKDDWSFGVFIGRVNGEDFVLGTNGKVDQMKPVPDRFRPVRARVDIKREEDINILHKTLTASIFFNDEDPVKCRKVRIAEYLYDVGYHKGPKVGDEVEIHGPQFLKEYQDWLTRKDFTSFIGKYRVYLKSN